MPEAGATIPALYTRLGGVPEAGRRYRHCILDWKPSRRLGRRYRHYIIDWKACAEAGGYPEPEIVNFDPKAVDLGKAKAFPFRDQHFLTSIDKAMADLDWTPEFGLVEGLRDSFEKDFGRGSFRKAADFSADDIILAAE